MLPPEPDVLLGRQGFPDAQAAMIGAKQPLGFFTAGWYGSDVQDERGSFALVNTAGPLFRHIGDYLSLNYQGRSVYVYVLGSQNNLVTDIAITRRCYMALALLAVEPIRADVALVTS